METKSPAALRCKETMIIWFNHKTCTSVRLTARTATPRVSLGWGIYNEAGDGRHSNILWSFQSVVTSEVALLCWISLAAERTSGIFCSGFTNSHCGSVDGSKKKIFLKFLTSEISPLNGSAAVVDGDISKVACYSDAALIYVRGSSAHLHGFIHLINVAVWLDD